MDIMNGLLGFGDKLYQAFLVEDRWRLYLDGLGVTLGITLGAICISTVLGMVLCLMKMSRHRILRWPAQAYIDIIRGIPVVVQLLIMYNVVLLNVTDNKMVVAVIAFGLNSSAYMAEIYRSGINAVDPGQMEAGRSLGMNYFTTMRFIVIPQAVKNILPALGNEFIMMLKETSLASTFFLGDIMTSYLVVKGVSYLTLEPLTIVAIIYLCVTYPLSKIVDRFGKKMANPNSYRSHKAKKEGTV